MPIIRRLKSAPSTNLANVRSAGPSVETGASKDEGCMECLNVAHMCACVLR